MTTEPLRNHIQKIAPLSDEELDSVLSFFKVQRLKRKELVLQEGQKCKSLFFVAKGCMRLFFFDDKGAEQTIQFAIETWWMTDLHSFNTKCEAAFNIQAIEETDVICIEKDRLEQMLLQHPAMDKYFSVIYQRAYAASLLRVKYIFSMSKEEFYDLFSTSYPAFLQRIPQYILASFLGFTPEYLSELKKKKLLKKN